MIVNTNNVEVETNQTTTEFELDNSNGQLFAVLSELYSKPVESTIREICTNCTDAHILSNNQLRPFIIKLPNYEKNILNISIRDFGPGLTHSEIMSIYKVYGKSTKTNNNNVTGCLGLGSKSPYSISSTFYVRSYKDGKMSLYVCTMGNNGKPNITDEPVVVDTFEENGLEVVIPFYKEVNFESILKDILKYFKVKPLVYRQESELEQDTLIDMDWVPVVGCSKVTDTIYLPERVRNIEAFCSALENHVSLVKPEVIQLQIYYPLDFNIIKQTIERYNKLYTNERNETVKFFHIDEEVIKTIKYIFTIGFQFFAEPGMIAFSPSREYIKYTDITLIYIIKELIKAAKIILKQVNSQYGLIQTKEQVFDKLIGRSRKYNLLSKYFKVNNPNVGHILNEFNKDIPLNRLVGATHNLSLWGNKVKRYPANFKESFPIFSKQGIINIKHTDIDVINNLVSGKYVALDCYDTTGDMVGSVSAAMFFCTVTNAFQDFVKSHITEYINYLIQEIKDGLYNMFEQVLFRESEAVLLTSRGLVENNDIFNIFKLPIKKSSTENIITIDRHQLFEDIKKNIDDSTLNYLVTRFSSMKSEIKYFESASKNPYASNYVKELLKVCHNLSNLDHKVSVIFGKSFYQTKMFDEKIGVEFKLNIKPKELQYFMVKLSPYFIKFAHYIDANPSRFIKRLKECNIPVRDYNISTWALSDLITDEKVKELNTFLFSGSVLKIKILKDEITNNLLLFETLMLELLRTQPEIFKNQNLLGKADKFGLYKTELESFDIPLKYCFLKPFEKMTIVQNGISKKNVYKQKNLVGSKVGSFIFKFPEIPELDHIMELTIAAHNLVNSIKDVYNILIRDKYLEYQTALRSERDPIVFQELLSKYDKYFRSYGIEPDSLFTMLLGNINIAPDYNSSITTYENWELLKPLFVNHQYSFDQTWENYNELIKICYVLQQLYTEISRYPSSSINKDYAYRVNRIVLNDFKNYVVFDNNEVKYCYKELTQIYTFTDGKTYLYTKPNNIKSLIFVEDKHFTVLEKTNEENINWLVENYKVSMIIKGATQKLSVGTKDVFQNDNIFSPVEKNLSETRFRTSKKFVKESYTDQRRLVPYLHLYQEPTEFIYLIGMDEVFNNKQVKDTYNVFKILLKTLSDTRYYDIHKLSNNVEYVYSNKIWNYDQEIPALGLSGIKKILTEKGIPLGSLRTITSSGFWQLLLLAFDKEDVVNYFKETKTYLALDSGLKQKYLEFSERIFEKAVKDLTLICKLADLKLPDKTNLEEYIRIANVTYPNAVSESIKRFNELRSHLKRDLSDLGTYSLLPAIPERTDSEVLQIKNAFEKELKFIYEYINFRAQYQENQILNGRETLLKLVEKYKNGFNNVQLDNNIKKIPFEELIKNTVKYKKQFKVNQRINLREKIAKGKKIDARTNLQLRKCGVF